jgi:1-acyl-sn-glycerol-3-phosphate acyltransferase
LATLNSEYIFFSTPRIMPEQSSIMGKKSLQYTPVGPYMTMSGGILVDRGNNARAVRSLQAAGHIMEKFKVSVMMYPEGTRRNAETSGLLPFKKGGFHLAVQSGIPIVPVVTENYWKIYHWGSLNRGTIRVRGMICYLAFHRTTDQSSFCIISSSSNFNSGLNNVGCSCPCNSRAP